MISAHHKVDSSQKKSLLFKIADSFEKILINGPNVIHLEQKSHVLQPSLKNFIQNGQVSIRTNFFTNLTQDTQTSDFFSESSFTDFSKLNDHLDYKSTKIFLMMTLVNKLSLVLVIRIGRCSI